MVLGTATTILEPLSTLRLSELTTTFDTSPSDGNANKDADGTKQASCADVVKTTKPDTIVNEVAFDARTSLAAGVDT